MAERFVWVVEYNDYDQRGPQAIAESPEVAFDHIRGEYASEPYVVAWDEPKQLSDEEWQLVAHFEDVPDLSLEHDASWLVSRMTVLQPTGSEE